MRISGTYLETYEKMRLSVSTPAKTIDLSVPSFHSRVIKYPKHYFLCDTMVTGKRFPLAIYHSDLLDPKDKLSLQYKTCI